MTTKDVAITAAIADIKAELEFMRRPRRRVRRYATVIIMVIAGAGFLIAAAHAEDAKPAAEQQLASIERSVSEIYDNLTIQTERLQLIELEARGHTAALHRRRAQAADMVRAGATQMKNYWHEMRIGLAIAFGLICLFELLIRGWA